MARFCAQQETQSRCAISEGCRNYFQAYLRDLVDRKRQHVRRQPVTETRERTYQGRAMRLVVQQYDRALAARIAIGGQQCAQSAHQRIGRRQRIGGGTCRAGGRALSASSANPRVDRYVIARRHDRAGRAEI